MKGTPRKTSGPMVISKSGVELADCRGEVFKVFFAIYNKKMESLFKLSSMKVFSFNSS